MASGQQPVHLHEEGMELPNIELPKNMFIILGDQADLTENEESLLSADALKISLGPRILHTDHCIILIHNALDKQEYLD